MKVEAHDLLKLYSFNENSFDIKLPYWAYESIIGAPYVVVRRGKHKQIHEKAYIPIGIRGKYREERIGCYLLENNIQKVISPEQIVEEKLWNHSLCFRWKNVLGQFEKVLYKWKKKLVWGPTGSVGFELVTKQRVTNNKSDLDIIIKLNESISVKESKKLLNELRNNSLITDAVDIDAIMKTNKGWVSLEEYATGIGVYLVKTESGEKLLKDVW